jgi:hypothetical protein
MVLETTRPTHPENPPTVRYYAGDDGGQVEALGRALAEAFGPLVGLWAVGEAVTVCVEARGVRARITVATACAREAESSPFVPTAFQQDILDALEGKALRTDALAARVGDRSRLFRHPGGLKELQEQGRVAHHKRLGYYSVESPPPGLR